MDRQNSRMMDSDASLGEKDEDKTAKPWWQWCLIALLFIGAPVLCRCWDLPTPYRCVVVILMVLILNIAEAMPLYCLALLVPVLGTVCAVLGEETGMESTATRLVAQIFNSTSSLILGALVINSIFAKCGAVERVLLSFLQAYPLDSAVGLLLLMLGSTAASCILYSCSIMLLSSLRPFLMELEDHNAAKRVMLGVAFTSNAGSTWLTISSPVNLIAVDLLQQFDHLVSPYRWASVAIPISILSVVCSWSGLITIFPCNTQSTSLLRIQRTLSCEDVSSPASAKTSTRKDMGRTEYFFLTLAFCAVLAITIWDNEEAEPLLGHPAMISLSMVAITFGSGFLSREDFLQLDWDLLMIVGGTNVIAFLVRETGLGKALSDGIVQADFITNSPFQLLLSIVICVLVVLSTFLSHTLTGVIVLPLVGALGARLNAMRTVTLLSAIAIPFGMGMPFSSFDNAAALTMSKSLGKRKFELKQRDFRLAGSLTSVCATVIILFLGGQICEAYWGRPLPITKESGNTPDRLKPRNLETPEEVLRDGNGDGWQARRKGKVPYGHSQSSGAAWRNTSIHYRSFIEKRPVGEDVGSFVNYSQQAEESPVGESFGSVRLLARSLQPVARHRPADRDSGVASQEMHNGLELRTSLRHSKRQVLHGEPSLLGDSFEQMRAA